jgi:molybdopterin-dependent oxidoreductase alpha subunit
MPDDLDSTPHPTPPGDARIETYDGPAGGWGSLGGIAKTMGHEHDAPVDQLVRQNKPDGFMCVSCAWSKPARPHPAEFCENGAKATIWDLTPRRCTPDFFARHTATELLGWSDFDLEQAGRLTAPMRFDHAQDRYVECGWEEAFSAIGAALKPLDPKKVVFYSSGRASLETSYMYALMARMYGSQNLPDSSNMCHESTSVGLKKSIGAPVGTVVLEDFEKTDAIFFFGQNVGSNSPRLLHDLQAAARRGVPIVTFNPLREAGLEKFINPQSPFQMVTNRPTRISTQYLQVKTGGDMAAILAMCKWLIEADDEARAQGAEPVLDHPFIDTYTADFEAFAEFCRDASWNDLVRESGLEREALEEAARTYARARAAIVVYGMGVTQHHLGVECVQMICNLLLLRGNLGKEGAGACPVRGHSNVQGQRTVGITEKPGLVPIEALKAIYGFDPPTYPGLNTVTACQGILKREVKAFVSLGGNFVRAIPDRDQMERAWRDLELTVQIATKLNRSHLINGKVAYLLPCLSRIERDVQATGPQTVSTEDSTSCIHASFGERRPASEKLKSEPAIVAGIAKALLPPNPRLDWDAWVGDYALVRDAIEATYPQWFKDFNARFRQPGGFHRGNKARERDFTESASGKANFVRPTALNATGFVDKNDVFRLMTLRSNDQFNTTVYGYEDRFRGVSGTRDVLFANAADMARLGLQAGQIVGLSTDAADGVVREHRGLRLVPYDIPEGCLGAYYPECNDLIPLGHYAKESYTPAVKAVPVRILA